MPILSEPLSNQGFYFFAHFEGDVGLYREKIEKIFVPYLTTGGDNERFLRIWYEVSVSDTAFERNPGKKWMPINKRAPKK